MKRIDELKAPLFVSWQLTRECDLSCLHCCTESAPRKRMAHELSAREALKVAEDLIRNEVTYVMLCGGEPLMVPHFQSLAETLGRAGVQLKIETNGQQLDARLVERLARLPIRSIQISLDADSQEVYERQRPGGSLARAHAACAAVRQAGLPLEITFAPTRLNIHQAGAVIARSRALGAFRFNTGRLMRIGTAARLWHRLEATSEQYEHFMALLERQRQTGTSGMELCFLPVCVSDGLRATLAEPPATLLVLPDGRVKVAAALPYICADLRQHSMAEAWRAYLEAWRSEAVRSAAGAAIEEESLHERANRWQWLPAARAG